MTAGLLTFERGGGWFAVAAAAVAEVAKAGAVTRLPFAPPHVDGVAAVGGRLVPLVDPAGYPALGLDRRAAGALFVVLRTPRGALALRAGRTAGTVTDAPLQAPTPETDAAGLPVTARFAHDGTDVLVIDPARIEIGPGTAFTDMPARAVLLGDPPEESVRRSAASVRLLVVECGGRRLALGMDGLLMVFAIAEVRPLPHAPTVVRGMTQARRRPVLLIDPLSGEGRDDGYAVAFRTARGPVALRVDAVRGVMRVAPDRMTTEAGAPGATVEYDGARIDVGNGARMVSEQLDRIAGLVPATGGPADGLEPPRRVFRRFLTVSVGDSTYALEVERVHRVVEYSGRQRLPGGTIRFDGITGVDGAILPVVDLRRVLVHTPEDRGVAVLVPVGGGTVAVVADAIQRIRKVPADEVDAMADATTAAVVRIDGRLIPVLRPEGLVAAHRAGNAA
ncbi:MAG TPA: chemotaxis protein CheW [Azospirillum sp.]|nr:chemotaxis protein CheW [Azospirillum sp.]